jgi:hypothetical protein
VSLKFQYSQITYCHIKEDIFYVKIIVSGIPTGHVMVRLSLFVTERVNSYIFDENSMNYICQFHLAENLFWF